jgi:hypothetical protein
MVPSVVSAAQILSSLGLCSHLFTGLAIKEVDDRVPSMAEILQRFRELPANAPSFVTLKIAEKIAKMRQTVGFLPLGKTPRLC